MSGAARLPTETISRRRVLHCAAAAVLLVLAPFGCEPAATPPASVGFTGETMGTTYSVRLAAMPEGKVLETIREKVDQRLADVNRLMSNWDPESEISRFNASDSTDWFPVSVETVTVVAAAQETSRATEGAFDVTVGPLIDLWGFGPAGRRTEAPAAAEIEALKEYVGYEKLDVQLDPPALRKQHPKLTINLSAIAKGYGVDVVGETLESEGLTNYLVEIGGEVRTRGKKSDGTKWKIGVERPESGVRTLEEVVELEDDTLASSGDYRNFYEQEGSRFSHTLDPATLRPIDHSMAAVTVFSENTMLADARATAIMVLGPDRGYDYVKSLDLPAMLIVHEGDGFKVIASPAWVGRFGEPK